MAQPLPSSLLGKFRQIEQDLQCRLGVAIIDSNDQKHWLYNAHRRFPLTSTFKVLAAAALLARVDKNLESLDRLVAVSPADLVDYSPITQKKLATGISLGQAAEAALTWSDNTAGNILLKAVGGPQALTKFMRTINDTTTRLDRWETDLNEAKPGDPRDTSTPLAMAESLQKLVLGSVLSTQSRQQLLDWLKANQVGDPLLRAGLPGDYVIADKTGSGEYGSRAIVAVIWPPRRQPIIVGIYLTQTAAGQDQRNAAIADIGRSLAAVL